MLLLNKIPRVKPHWVKGSLIELMKCLCARQSPRQGKSAILLFEKRFSALLGSRHAVAINSGRNGLLLIMKSLNLKKGDEIILSAYNSPIIPLVIKKAGLKPVFADIDLATLNIDVSSIKKKLTGQTKAIIALHTEGQPCDMNQLMLLARKHRLFVIEDCAHALLGEFKSKKLGAYGDASFFSFGMGKHINTLGGSMILTDNDLIYKRMREELALAGTPSVFASRMRLVKKYFIDSIACAATLPLFFSCAVFFVIRFFNMMKKDITYSFFEDKVNKKGSADKIRIADDFSVFQAWLGLEQLNVIKNNISERRRNAAFLQARLFEIKGVRVQSVLQSGKGSFLQFPILVEDPERIISGLMHNGVDCQRTWLKCCDASCSNAKKAEQRCIYIPAYSGLSSAYLSRVARALE